MATIAASKPIRFYVLEKTFVDPRDPKNASKRRKAYQAIVATRGRISFRDFCGRLSRGTTFTQQEIEAVINYATEMAREFVANGDIVEFGDLGALIPTFKSKASAKAEDFDVFTHISYPRVRLSASRKFFDLRTFPGVSFQRIEPPTLKGKGKKGKKDAGAGTSPKEKEGKGPQSGAGGSEDNHLGI